jgi:hypothetical protein
MEQLLSSDSERDALIHQSIARWLTSLIDRADSIQAEQEHLAAERDEAKKPQLGGTPYMEPDSGSTDPAGFDPEL